MYDISRRGLFATGALFALALTTGCSGDVVEQNNSVEADVTAAATPAYALITQPVGVTAPADYSAQLAAARTAGDISEVTLLQSKPSVEGPVGFASLAVVTFPSEAAFDKWSRNTAPKLGAGLIVRRADILVDDRARTHSASPAYVVNHYEALIPKDDYTAYTTAYIKPNMDGQKAGGVMAGYAMYYEREPVSGTKGNRTVLVKEYTDEAAFGRSEAIKEKDKVELLKNAEWKRINDTKSTLRTDIAATLALPVAVR